MKQRSSSESWENRPEGFSETAGRDNYGHHPGPANQRPSDEVAASVGSERAEGPTPAPNPQKATYEELMEEIVSPFNAWRARLAVERNGGAPGIDGMTTEQLREHLQRHGEKIRAKLLAGTYVPSPVRRVEIPKPEGKGMRMLGIPTVLDRWIQQMLLRRLKESSIQDSVSTATHSGGDEASIRRFERRRNTSKRAENGWRTLMSPN